MKTKIYFGFYLGLLLLLPCAAVTAQSDPAQLRAFIPMVLSGYQIGGGVGSGFVVTVRDNPNEAVTLVVTNAHVIEATDTIEVVFMSPEGVETRYKNIRIIANNEAQDVAVLSLMGQYPFEKGFKINMRPPADGDILATGGYPGASWAYESMVGITNARVRLRVEKSREVLEFIRMSSSIDKGSSGGPLIRPDGTELGFSVMGINTLSSRNGKQGFAIPVQRFLPVIVTALKKAVPGWEGENHAERNRAELFEKSVSGCFENSGEADWYRINCQAGEFALRSNSPDNLELSLYDSAGQILGRESGKNPDIRVRLEEPGELFIEARPGQREYFQTYYLYSCFASYDSNEDDSAENPLPVHGSQWVERSLYTGDEDWFEVQALGPRMKVDCDTGFSILLPGEEGPVYQNTVTRDTVVGNTYKIKVLPGDSPKDYRFRVSFPVTEQEPNNTLDEAQTLERGLFVNADTNGDDSDWYRIPAQTRDRVSIRVEGGVSFEVSSGGAADQRGLHKVEKNEKIIEFAANGDIFIHVIPRSVYRTSYTVGFDVSL